MKSTGLLNNADLAEFASRDLPGISFGTDAGRVGRMEDGIRLSIDEASTPQPFDVQCVTKGTGNGPWEVVRVTPGVVVGCQGFVVPTTDGVSIVRSPAPTIYSPLKYGFLAVTFDPKVVVSTVSQTALKPEWTGETCTIHWIAAATMTDCSIVWGDSISAYNSENYDGIAWTLADGKKGGTLYIPFAQWNEDELRYRNLVGGSNVILNCRPSGDVVNVGAASETNTSAAFLFG